MSCEIVSELGGEKILQYNSLEKLRNSRSVSVGHEVPLLGRIVDLVYIQDGTVVTVEFKIHDWRRAISQARDHLLGADYAYICMPKRKTSERLLTELERVGVGLFFYRENDVWPFQVVVSAPKSKETWPVARSMVVNYVLRQEMR